MKNKFLIKYSFLAIAVLSLFLSSCEKSILTDDPGSVDSRNINLKIYSYFGENLLSPDSIYNINGSRVIIDDINLLLSNFIFDNSGDSIYTDGYNLTNLKKNTYKIGLLKPGSVSGSFYFKVGLDSAANASKPTDWMEGDFLANTNIYNTKAKSYNFITVKGRIFNPQKPDEVVPSIPLNYAVATDVLVTQMFAPKSFSVPVGKPVVLDAIFNVDELFNNLDPKATPIIKSDPANTADFDKAVILRANFENCFNVH